MKKAFCLLIVLFFALQPLTVTMNDETEPENADIISTKVAKSLTGYKICVDPGHGGSDSGAEGYDGPGYSDEKDFNLDVGLRLRDILETDNATVIMTSTTNITLSNQTRCDIANNNNTDIFVSIHCNSSLNENDMGTETFYWANNETSYSVNGKKLAGYVQNEMIKQLDLNDRGIKGDKTTLGYHLDVLQNTTMPAILIYVSFISNQTEFNLMNTTGFRQNIAVAIYNGICQYFDRASRNYKSTLYDRKAVTGYADLYWGNYNPEYADYSASGGDCANFVSQCTIAGGLSLWQGRDGNGGGVDSYGTMPFCDYLHEHLVKYQNACYSYIEYSGKPPDYLTEGDIIIYGDASDETSPDYWRHAVIVVEGSGINCKVSGHTTDRYHVSWDYAFSSSFNRTNFYHLTDKTINEYSGFEVTASALNVRTGPGIHAPYDNPIGEIHKGERYIAYEYVINATGKKWWHFWFDDRPVWCSATYTTAVNENTTFKVKVDSYLNVRDGPGTGYSVVDKIFDGGVFLAFDKATDGSYTWYNFWWNGSSAWCASGYTTVVDSPLRSVSGWTVYWDSGSIQAFKNNAGMFDEVSPFWYDANADGSITALSGAGNQSLVSFAHNHSVKVIPLISNEYDKNIVHSIISNPLNMSRHISNVTELVVTNDYDGIDIDYEGIYASDNENFTVFIRNLSATLHEKHKSLSVTVQAKWSDSITWDGPGAMDYKNLSRYADKMRIMAYDEHWSTSEPGPIASTDWVENIVNYAVRRCSREIVLGVPNYGRDWWYDAGWHSTAYTYNGIISLMNSEGASRQWNDTAKVPYFTYYDHEGDEKDHTVYYEDNESLGYKLDLVNKYNISGTSIWRLGNEDQNNWGVIEKKFSIGKTCSVYLKEGWNFISLSLNASYSAETLAKNIENCTHISKWDSTIQNFTIYKRKSYIGYFEIEKNKGYLIYVSSSTFFCIAGKKFGNVTINLKAGWNSIGWHNFTKTKVKNLGQNITNCTAVAYWNNTLGRFIIHPVGTNISNFDVKREMGVFVYVTTSSTYIN